jgi:hypothetical protein
VEYVVPISSDDRVGGLPPRRRSATSGLTGGACQLRAIRGGHWRRLTVTHGHSGHVDLRPLL